jgi:hypothetical protein
VEVKNTIPKSFCNFVPAVFFINAQVLSVQNKNTRIWKLKEMGCVGK